MAQISIIQKSDITKAGRFDAEYFKPEYLEIEKKIEKLNNNFLFNIANNSSKKYKPSNNNFDYIEISKVDLITGEYEKQNILDDEKPSRAQNICNKFDLLISTVRPNRNAVSLILEDTNNNLVASTGFCKLSQIKTNPYYLYILFKTDLYIKLLDRKTTATQYPAVSEDDILNLKIPLLSKDFQSSIEKTVKEAYQKQAQSKQLYKDAENLLLTELDLLDYQPQHQLTFDTIKKEVERAGRFDAEYFQPKYADIIKRIENYAGGFGTVKNMLNWKKGIEVGTKAYTENGKDFIRVSDVSINGVEKTNRKISNALFDELKKDFQPKKGDILFTKDGTIGITNVVSENLDGVVSSAFLRLTLRGEYLDFEKECLTLILNSVLCKMQVEKLSGGAIIAHLKPSDFDKFKIPLIKQSIQQQIAQKITQSHQLRTESKDLLELAKLKVEQAIES